MSYEFGLLGFLEISLKVFELVLEKVEVAEELGLADLRRGRAHLVLVEVVNQVLDDLPVVLALVRVNIVLIKHHLG